MTRYIYGKEWDAKFLEALVSERMKDLITKHCPNMQIGGMKGKSSSEHLIVVKTWKKTNEIGETTCIFEAFDMEKSLIRKDSLTHYIQCIHRGK